MKRNSSKFLFLLLTLTMDAYQKIRKSKEV